jgi:hypothetical protein
MIIECKKCHKRLGTARAVTGVVTFLCAAILTGILLGMGVPILERLKVHLSWLFLLVGAIFIWLLLSWFVWELPRWLTFLRYGLKRCPECGARDWGRPHYSGFGV